MPKSQKTLLSPITLSTGRKTKVPKTTPPPKSGKTVKLLAPVPMLAGGNRKQALLVSLLQREHGATLHEMAEATGWQHHSVHGAMSGALKKKLQLQITATKEERGRVYRIAG